MEVLEAHESDERPNKQIDNAKGPFVFCEPTHCLIHVNGHVSTALAMLQGGSKSALVDSHRLHYSLVRNLLVTKQLRR